MSVKASNWAWQLQCVKGMTKLVLMALADSADDDGFCWPKLETLAFKACTSKSTVKRAVRDLSDLGLVTVEHRTRQNGSSASNYYTINIGFVPDEEVQDAVGVKMNPHSTYEEQTDLVGGQNEPLVGGQSDPGRGSQVTPLYEPSLKPKNPLTPEGDGRGGALADEELGSDWDRFCKIWSLAPGDSFERAKRAWRKLDVFEQGKAVKFAGRYQAAAKGNSRKTAARTYLAQHLWEGFERTGAAPPGKQRVFVVQDTPAWDAWREHLGRPSPIGRDPDTGKPGWWFDSLFPPVHTEDQRNAS
ncbi:helix-turn-helix domain-containing protein [uncultured Cohaesibacter sp.]|uniref:helix-turn-helix domain-containing protein n=1 Tax=uncultured Cohaesibacter sp. TaxID=1002546 RepID=UPI0029C8E890|nr:helix-turn-helix domain-containing protein [uncultured Cohaesibacter sp.]